MTRRRKKRGTVLSLLSVLGVFLAGLTIYSAYQTLLFVIWLFPAEALAFRILAFSCFDVAAVIWALCDLFLPFESEDARIWTRWGWGVTAFLAVSASILYMVIDSFFRLHVTVSGDLLDLGYGISIFALFYNIAILTLVLCNELPAQKTASESHARYQRRKTRGNAGNGNGNAQVTQGNASVTLGNAGNVTQLPPPRMTRAQIQRRYRQNQKQKGFLP